MLGMFMKPLMFFYLANSGNSFMPITYNGVPRPQSSVHQPNLFSRPHLSVNQSPLFSAHGKGENFELNDLAKETLRELLDEKNHDSTEEILKNYENKVANKKSALEERILDFEYVNFDPDWVEVHFTHHKIYQAADGIFAEETYKSEVFVAKVKEFGDAISSTFSSRYKRQIETMLNSLAIDFYLECLSQNSSPN